jgi:membrane protein
MAKARQALVFLLRVWRRFMTDACPGRAAGLAFSTLFALVPLVAVVFAVLNGFGVFDTFLQDGDLEIVGQLVPAVSQEVTEAISQFASNTRTLGILGFLLFVITATLLVRNVHVSLNAIWRFRAASTAWTAIATYTAVIVIGTFLVAVSFSVGPVVQSILSSLIPDRNGLAWFRGPMFSFLLLYLLLFLMNIIVPSGRVRAGAAAIGAAVAAVIWEIAKQIFVLWTGSVMRLSVIYGSLAAVPIFLIWLYLSWFIALCGVELAFAIQHRDEFLHADDEDETVDTVPELVELCLRTYLEVVRRFRDGEQPMLQEDLDALAGTNSGDMVRNTLEQGGLLVATDRGLLPSRTLDSVTVKDVVDALVAATDNGKTAESTDVINGNTATRFFALAAGEPLTPVSSAQVLSLASPTGLADTGDPVQNRPARKKTRGDRSTTITDQDDRD